MKDATIIGAGIGGLTTAIALQQRGIETSIYEQSSELRPVGAGIILSNNVMQVYQQLGLKDKLERAGNIISRIAIADHKLNILSSISLDYFEKKYGVKNVAIHRGKLQEVLKSAYTSEIKLGYKLDSLDLQASSVELHFKNKDSVTADLVIGADGIHSDVREVIFPQSEIRDSDQICWRGVLDYTLPDTYKHQLTEAWGRGKRIGFVQISEDKVYWFAVHDSSEFSKSTDGNFISYFSDFDPMMVELLSQTDKASIHEDILSDLRPLKSWHNGRVCLLGDAAHATTPNMGQGAGQAIEDAYTISLLLEKYNYQEAFEKFYDVRSGKVHQVVNTSWSIGKLAHWRNPLAVGIRNNLMKLLPESANRKQTEKIFTLPEIQL